MTTNAARDATAVGTRQTTAKKGDGQVAGGTSVVLQSLSRAFGATRALDGLSIEMAPGAILTGLTKRIRTFERQLAPQSLAELQEIAL